MSHVQKVIPDSVKNWWTQYRAALSKAETEQLGNNDISDAVEKATWGVEEAQRANKAEASKSTRTATRGLPRQRVEKLHELTLL